MARKKSEPKFQQAYKSSRRKPDHERQRAMTNLGMDWADYGLAPQVNELVDIILGRDPNYSSRTMHKTKAELIQKARREAAIREIIDAYEDEYDVDATRHYRDADSHMRLNIPENLELGDIHDSNIRDYATIQPRNLSKEYRMLRHLDNPRLRTRGFPNITEPLGRHRRGQMSRWDSAIYDPETGRRIDQTFDMEGQDIKSGGKVRKTKKRKKSGGKVKAYASHNKRYAYGGKVSGRKAKYNG